MSFKPDISANSIFNEALALLPAQPVQGEDEPSLEARECRRFYKGVVAKLLEQHHWNLATKRGVLAETVNERDDEWGYAYTKPTDMAYPVALLPAVGAGWSGWRMHNWTYFLPGGQPLFMQAKGVLFSSVGAARLEYTSFDINEGDFSSLFKELVVLHLAAKICHPITKDAARARELQGQAEFERLRAIANDMNRNQPTYGNRPTETEIVRGAGIDYNLIGTGYPLDPVAHPSNTGT